ncbi:MAG: HK97 family phage prohead protease [Oscillospiraceae bacterium]|nr:HK97 family phage prohead protease [Oscillospiraceae bacterium]
MTAKITRAFPIELRSELNDNKYTVTGTPAVCSQRIKVGNYFEEIIMPGAFIGCDFSDVPLFVNHDTRGIPLARSRRNNSNSSLLLTADEKGISMRTILDVPGNPQAAALYSAVERGDISGMSFAFLIRDEVWKNLDSELPLREIHSIAKVFEVSAVNHPAYDATEISARERGALENDLRALENAKRQLTVNSEQTKIKQLREKIKIYGGLA